MDVVSTGLKRRSNEMSDDVRKIWVWRLGAKVRCRAMRRDYQTNLQPRTLNVEHRTRNREPEIRNPERFALPPVPRRFYRLASRPLSTHRAATRRSALASETPSFSFRCSRYVSTVLGLILRCSAISRLRQPAPSIWKTSSSRSDSRARSDEVEAG